MGDNDSVRFSGRQCNLNPRPSNTSKHYEAELPRVLWEVLRTFVLYRDWGWRRARHGGCASRLQRFLAIWPTPAARRMGAPDSLSVCWPISCDARLSSFDDALGAVRGMSLSIWLNMPHDASTLCLLRSGNKVRWRCPSTPPWMAQRHKLFWTRAFSIPIFYVFTLEKKP